MAIKTTNDNKIIVTPASQVKFRNEATKKKIEKVTEKKKEWADLYKIDGNKLNIKISI